MQDLLSPKQVANALNVSESSVKRWCDKGAIPAIYTDGGHRRVRLCDFAAFVRSRNLQVLNFDSLGLQVDGGAISEIGSAQASLTEALLAGDEDQCSRIILGLYFAKYPIHRICDEVIAGAFHHIGDKWACGSVEIYQERRGCCIALRIMEQLRKSLPTPDSAHPTAIGAAAEGDMYSLGSSMVELVLRDAGWRAIGLGENLPLTSLAAAIENDRPGLVWVSCGHISDEDRFVAQFTELYETHDNKVAFIVGGRALNDSIVSRLPPAHVCQDMASLHELGQDLLTRHLEQNNQMADESSLPAEVIE